MQFERKSIAGRATRALIVNWPKGVKLLKLSVPGHYRFLLCICVGINNGVPFHNQ